MAKYKVGIIGCGRPHGTPGATGYGMSHSHAAGYTANPDTEIVAIAEPVKERRERFCEEHNVPRSYASAEEMFANENLDIVSVTLWPDLHAPMVKYVAQQGVKAIHCEKPMATSWKDARDMAKACADNHVQLTFNHQRRFGAPFRKAKELLEAGAIGQLERLEAYAGDLYDWGTHWFDMLFYYNDETPVKWVMGQLDARDGMLIFGAPVEGQGMSLFQYENGVMGMLVTGRSGILDTNTGLRSTACANRLIGATGTIEVGASGGPDLRYRNIETGGQWVTVPLNEGMHSPNHHIKAIADLVDALETGREPELAACRALQTAELIFATWDSSRKRTRIDMPLKIDDSPLQAMFNNGDITPWYDGYVEANGITLHYYRTGKGNKPVLVLAHGYSDNGLCWSPVARQLEKDYDIIMYDARGHGLSDAPERGYATADQAADLAGLVQALNLDKPAILGHSMGGATVGYAAAEYPYLFSKVLLEDPAWWENGSRRAAMTDEERYEMMEQRRQAIITQNHMSREALIAKCRQDSPLWADYELGNWAMSKQQLSPNVANIFDRKTRPWEEIAADFKFPALLITANTEKGAIVTTALSEKAMEINPLIQAVYIDAGHNIRREAFEAYLKAVRDFLAE